MTASPEAPRRGDVWLVALGASRAGEPGKTRPAIVTSSDELAIASLTDLIVVVPVSSSLAPSDLRIDVPITAGVERPSRAICRAIRAVTYSRFTRRLGRVDLGTMRSLETALAMILKLDAGPAAE